MQVSWYILSMVHEPYLICTKIPAFTSHECLESRKNCLAGNAHEGCQIHGMILARGSLNNLVSETSLSCK